MSEQVRDITAYVQLAVGGHHTIEPNTVLLPLDWRGQPPRRPVDLAHPPTGHRQHACYMLRVRRRHHPPGAGDLVEILGRDASVPTLVQPKKQSEIVLGHEPIIRTACGTSRRPV